MNQSNPMRITVAMQYETSREAVKEIVNFVVSSCMRSGRRPRTSHQIDDATNIISSDELRNPFRIQPSNLVKCLPELASLIDINLASLLGIRLSKFLTNLESLDSLDEDATLGGEVCGTIKAEVGCEINLVGVKEVSVWIVLEINRSTFPINFE